MLLTRLFQLTDDSGRNYRPCCWSLTCSIRIEYFAVDCFLNGDMGIATVRHAPPNAFSGSNQTTSPGLISSDDTANRCTLQTLKSR